MFRIINIICWSAINCLEKNKNKQQQKKTIFQKFERPKSKHVIFLNCKIWKKDEKTRIKIIKELDCCSRLRAQKYTISFSYYFPKTFSDFNLALSLFFYGHKSLKK